MNKNLRLNFWLLSLLFFFPPSTTYSKQQNIRFSFWGDSRDLKNMEKVIDEFETKNSNIKVKVEALGWGEYWTKLKTQAVGNRAPDVIMLYSGEAPQWYSKNVLADLDPYIKAQKTDLNQFFKVAIQAVTWKNKIYSLPIEVAQRVYVYNKDLFDAAKISYPDPYVPITWEKMFEISSKLTQKDPETNKIIQYGFSTGYLNPELYLYQAGGKIFDSRIAGSRIDASGPENLKALEFYRKLISGSESVSPNPKVQQTSGFGNSDFSLMTGKVALSTTGSWVIPDLVAKNNLRFGLAPIAQPKGKTRETLSLVNSIGIYSQSKNKLAAWKLIQYLTSKDGQIALTKAKYLLPANKQAAYSSAFLKPEYVSKVRNLDIFLKEIEYSNVNPMPIRAAAFDREFRRILWERMGLGNISAQQAQKEIQELDAIIFPERYEKHSSASLYYYPVLIGIFFFIGGIFLIRKWRLSQKKQAGQNISLSFGAKNNFQGYAFISPWLIGFFGFLFIPMISIFFLSLSQWDLLSAPQWIGVKNYSNLFQDVLFWKSLKVTSLFVLGSLPIQIGGGLICALVLINIPTRFGSFFRTLIYIPYLFSGVSLALLWKLMYSPDGGIFHSTLNSIGLQAPNWIMDNRFALLAIILTNLFWIGNNMLIFQAAIQNIPKSLFEAATLDYCGTGKKFLHITLPQISPVILFSFVMGAISSFQVFTEAYVITNGGPDNSTLFYLLYLFRKAFRDFDMGYACAMSLIFTGVILIITLLQMWSSKKWVHYES